MSEEVQIKDVKKLNKKPKPNFQFLYRSVEARVFSRMKYWKMALLMGSTIQQTATNKNAYLKRSSLKQYW